MNKPSERYALKDTLSIQTQSNVYDGRPLEGVKIIFSSNRTLYASECLSRKILRDHSKVHFCVVQSIVPHIMVQNSGRCLAFWSFSIIASGHCFFEQKNIILVFYMCCVNIKNIKNILF